MKKPLFFIILIMLIAKHCFAQYYKYKYFKPIINQTQQWHSIQLPPDIYQYCKADLSDIRVVGIKANSDTIEAPFFLKTKEIKIVNNPIDCQIINKTNKNGIYYFTLVLPENKSINQIDCQFLNKNFDWHITLQGSNDQTNWFTILKNYRILSIQNQYTNYQFTKIYFSEIRYNYLRISIPANQQPIIEQVLLNHQIVDNGEYQNFQTKNKSITNDKKNKQTIIDVTLPELVPISRLYIKANYPADFYRPFTIKALTDSIVTATGINYIYNFLYSNTISSLETPFFYFPQTVNRNFRIIIENKDNPPLNIDSILLGGFTHQLITRFDYKASYFLYYSNKEANRPDYDINHFSASMPENPAPLQLGTTIIMPETATKQTKPIVTNTLWLWFVIGAIAILISIFTLRMIQNHQKNNTDD